MNTLNTPFERRLHPLTNLPDRLSLESGIAEAIEEIPGQFGLLELDVDNLKLINDTEGHHGGDSYLKFIGGALKDLLRDDDRFVACHKYGDEFTIILGGVTTNEQIEAIKKRITDELESLGVGVSVGGRVHIPGETVEVLMEDADKLMYREKKTRAIENLSQKQIEAIKGIGKLATENDLNLRKVPLLLKVLAGIDHVSI